MGLATVFRVILVAPFDWLVSDTGNVILGLLRPAGFDSRVHYRPL